jgi:hypothetical protein
MKPKNVLIPTDFTVHSLDLIVAAARQFEGEQLNITLLHALSMPDSIMDLMFLSRNNDRYKLITKEFENACTIVKNRYASVIQRITVRFMHGSTRAVFRNFVEASQADVLICPVDYSFQKASVDSIDISKLFKYAGCALHHVELNKMEADVRKINMADLLLAVS